MASISRRGWSSRRRVWKAGRASESTAELSRSRASLRFALSRLTVAARETFSGRSTWLSPDGSLRNVGAGS